MSTEDLDPDGERGRRHLVGFLAIVAVILVTIAGVYLLLFRDTRVGLTARDAGIGEACPYPRTDEVPIADVAAGEPHSAEIACLARWEIVSAGPEQPFRPGDPLIRAQLATVLLEMITRTGGELPDSPGDRFADDDGSVHEQAINAVAELGIIGGTVAGDFDPTGEVTRGQTATFVVRLYEHVSGEDLEEAEDRFADDEVSAHEETINQAAAAGFLGGIVAARAETFGPGAVVTRAESASVLARVLNRLVNDGHGSPPP